MDGGGLWASQFHGTGFEFSMTNQAAQWATAYAWGNYFKYATKLASNANYAAFFIYVFTSASTAQLNSASLTKFKLAP